MPKKALQPDSAPKERTLETVQGEIRRLERSLHDSVESLKGHEEMIPNLPGFEDTDKSFIGEVIDSREDCAILIREKLKIVTEEYESMNNEIRELEEGIRALVADFGRLQFELDETLVQIKHYKEKEERREPLALHQHIDAAKKVGDINKAERKRERIRMEFESKIGQLQKVCPSSEVLKDDAVVKLTVLLVKSEREKARAKGK